MEGDFEPSSSGAPIPTHGGFLVIGGGVAGSTCAIELKRLCPSSKVTLVAPSSSLKTVRDLEQITPLVAVVDVRNRSAEEFALEHPGISLVCDEVTSIDADRNRAKLASGDTIAFTRCCVATGASPSLSYDHPRVLGIRDTESVANLSKRLVDARRVLIVGNGGIALELVQTLTSAQACQMVWAVRDAYVGNTFFDANASAFFLPGLSACGVKSREEPIPSTNSSPSPNPSRDSPFPSSEHPSRVPLVPSRAESGGQGYEKTPGALRVLQQTEPAHVLQTQPEMSGSPGNLLVSGVASGTMDRVEVTPHDAVCSTDLGGSIAAPVTACGASLGPAWLQALNIQMCPTQSGEVSSTSQESTEACHQQPLLDIQFECELDNVRDGEASEGSGGDGACWPVSATLTNGVVVDCDFVISATGAKANTNILGAEFERGRDGGFLVDERMRVARASASKATAEIVARDSCACPDDSDKDKDKHTPPAARKASVNLVPQHSIFAAGDCCCLEWPERESTHWFQMRLWSQAREMGLFTAKCMTDSVDELSGGAFDLFVHATRFFGHKVVLLGRFNGQGLGASVQDLVSTHLVLNSDDDVRLQEKAVQEGSVTVGSGSGEGSYFPLKKRRHESTQVKAGSSNICGDVQVLVRTSPGAEYIKVVLVRGRVRGAMLIGETGLEETFENLILSGTNISDVGADLLSLDVDVEDFFD